MLIITQMGQLTLTHEPKGKNTNVQPNADKTVKRIADNGSMWSKIHPWLERCRQQKENYAYFLVEYRADVHLDGSKDETLKTSATMERLFRREDDSYGGSWSIGGSYSRDDLDELKEALIAWRRNNLSAPYCREKADGTALRDIKAENIRIFLDDNAKDFIARTAKWSLNELAMELKSIKETPLTEEYLKKFDRMTFLNKEINKIEYDLLPGLKNKAEQAFGKKELQAIDGEQLDLNRIHSLYKRVQLKLSTIKKEYDSLRQELYMW